MLVRIEPGDKLSRAMVPRAKYILEQRLVMARYLARPLERWETVHHIDGNHANNAITNLQLRIGRHGRGVVYECEDCGSRRLAPIAL